MDSKSQPNIQANITDASSSIVCDHNVHLVGSFRTVILDENSSRMYGGDIGMNLIHGVYVCYGARYLLYLVNTHEQRITINRNMKCTISNFSTTAPICIYSSILPLLNHGVAMAGTGFVCDASDQTGQTFIWCNEDHVFSATVNA